MDIPKEFLSKEFLSQFKTGEDVTAFMKELHTRVYEQMLEAEMDNHLGYEKHSNQGDHSGNSRNGSYKKQIQTEMGESVIQVPRDRKSEFEPVVVPKHQSRGLSIERLVISLYAKGMSVSDIESEMQEIYGINLSTSAISIITNKVSQAASEWQNRPLESLYMIVWMDGIVFKVRESSKVINKTIYLAVGLNRDGKKEVLGMWLGKNESASFWLGVLTDLKARGVKDILIACVDGLKGFPDAITAVFPQTMIQLCIVHQIRTALRYMASKHHKEFVKDMKEIYRASNLENAEVALKNLTTKWGSQYPMAAQGWNVHWKELSTYFAFPVEIRKMIYTTNAVEAVHRQFRKLTKTKGAFPTDDSLKKMLYLATLDLKGAFRGKSGWPMMLGQLQILFEDRIPKNAI